MIRVYFLPAVLAAAVLSTAMAPLAADEGAFDKMYGKGVHAFFSNDYAKAHDCLSRAISAESNDPRCFYFRGLAYLELGRESEARCDFTKAADIEAGDAYKFFNVSKALERVQGKSRSILEQYRAKARLRAAARAAKLRRARYEELRDAEARVLQQQARSVTDQPAPVRLSKTNDPFTAGPLEDEAPAAAKKPAVKQQVVQKSEPKTSDPFAAAPSKPLKAKKQKNKKPVAKRGGGILGAIGKAVGKTAKSKVPKIGNKAAQKPAQAVTDDPFGENPFGSKPTAPKAGRPAKETVPADADDPFGEELPAEKTDKPAPEERPVDPDDPFA